MPNQSHAMNDQQEMNYQIEVCIDNLESLHLAIEGGATRIELCSALALGGLTPSVGMMQRAGQLSRVPVYAMIRPRQGDFVYDDDDLAIMACDIQAAASAKLHGVVLGLLTCDATVDIARSRALVELAHQLGLGVTFHRAIDQSRDGLAALDAIIELGCQRVLTSGLAENVVAGKTMLRALVEHAAGRIEVMAGAGLNAANVAEIVQSCGVREVHLSGKQLRPSAMRHLASQTHMGAQHIDDFVVPVTNPHAIRAVVDALKQLN